MSEWGPALGTQSGLASPVSNMTYFAEERRLEMDAVLKKAGHTVRLGVSKLGARSGHASMDSVDQHERITLLGVRSQGQLGRKSSKRVQTGEPILPH